MKLFSFSSLGKNAGETLRRFPGPIFTAIIGTVTAIKLVHQSFEGTENYLLENLLMTLYLAMLFTISVTLYAERFTFSAAKRNFTIIFVLIILALYINSLPEKINIITGMRFALFTIGLHLLVSFTPFLVRGEQNGLWQFNKSLFIRILTSTLYSGVLFAGLALAMLAVDKLFDIHINEKYYLDLWVVIAGIFNTWFFLSGVPENLSSLEDVTDYPKGLKVFTVYVLLPLITIYLVILYLYAGKILITANWPVGWVGYMVIAFSIFGILSFLLIYPLRNDEATPFKFYSRLFYFLLIPPIALLFAAIFKRINMYGITEDRYFVLVLAFWLSFIAVYFILTNGKNIRMIPLSLCLVVFLSSFGPWGAFTVSHNNQFNELTLLLDSNHILAGGKVDTTKTHDVKSKDYDRIESIARYINNVHGHEKLQTYFYQNLDSLIAEDKKDNSSSRGENNLILDLLKMNKIESADDNSPNLYFRVKGKIMLHASGYDFVKEFSIYYRDNDLKLNLFFETDSIQFVNSSENGNITLTCRDFEPLVLGTKEMLTALPTSGKEEISPDYLTLEADNRQWKAKIIFSSVNFSKDQGKLKFDNANGLLMLRINNAEENEVGEKGNPKP